MSDGASDRAYWVEKLRQIAEPVLTATAARELKRRMPVEQKPNAGRQRVSHLEAVARLLVGIAPWLEADLGDGPREERDLQARYRDLARGSIEAIVDPASPDYCNWSEHGQPLVDGAFLAHALLRAPRELHDALAQRSRTQLHEALRLTRTITPGMNNWLLFAAMVEAALLRFTGEHLHAAVRFALVKHEDWYKGDGAYGDGREFHFDYYNSYVIQPMLLDILERPSPQWMSHVDQHRTKVIARAERHAAVQERLIAADGSFPVIGRSIAYRGGAFQLLAQMALRRELPEGVAPAQVRGALTAVLRRTLEPAGTFDAAGWLRIGLAGHQPGLGESYISTGSLYLCSAIFLPLGLPAGDPFWQDAPADWTARQAWSGAEVPADHAYGE